MTEPVGSELIHGNTGPVWLVGVPLISVDGVVTGWVSPLTDYECTLFWPDAAGAEQTRQITATNTSSDRFLVWLTAAESQAMAAGRARMGVEITNASSGYVSEVQIDLTIAQQRYVAS